MENAIFGAMAALCGSSVGAVTPVLNNYLSQRSQIRREIFTHQLAQRETLYSDFITAAAKLYASSISKTEGELDDLVGLYAIVSRIRLVASEAVLAAAEKLVKQIVNHYGDPNLDFDQIRQAVLSNANGDPLRAFSLACRDELTQIVAQGARSR